MTISDPSTASAVLDEHGAKFLDRDFEQSFMQMRHYDGQIIEIVKFALAAFAPIAGGSLAIYQYGIEHHVDYRSVSISVVATGLLVGLTLLALAARNRVYFVRSARYINEQRRFFMQTQPLGFRNEAGMYTSPAQPAYFNWWSSQTLFLGTLGILNAGLLGLGLHFGIGTQAGGWWSVLGFAAAALVGQAGFTFAYLRSHEKKGARVPAVKVIPSMPEDTGASNSNVSRMTEEPLDADAVRVLCDLAIKRHDLAERTYDSLNTRLGAVFAFNSFLIPASIAALRPTTGSPQPLTGWPYWAAIVVWAVSLVAITVATLIGFRAQAIKSLPDAFKLDRDFATKPPVHVSRQIVRCLDDAWAGLCAASETKSACLNYAIGFVALELLGLVAVSVFQMLR